MTPLPSQVGGEPRELRLRQRQRGGLRAVGPGGGATSGGVTGGGATSRGVTGGGATNEVVTGGGATSGGVTGGGATSGDEPQSDKM
jgi:hypothetical protein